MVAHKSILLSVAPYHILSYGTLLGTEIFQSFAGGIIAFRVLPRPSFSVLQQGTFPVYFGMQSVLPLLLAVTYPFRAPDTPALLAITTDRSATISVGAVFLSGLINWLYVGPQTTKVMRERKHQETRDGKKYYDAGPKSQEMSRLNKKFGVLHGASTLVNLVAIGATIWYGFVLGEKIPV